MWLAGLLVSGEVFLWDRDKDSLKMITAVPAVYELASSGKGVHNFVLKCHFRLRVKVSC